MYRMVRDSIVAKNERGTAASPKPSEKPPAKPQPVQLGFVGVFPANYENDAQKLRLQKAGNFSPDTDDFTRALKQGKHLSPNIARTPTLGKILDQIRSHPDGSISRIDLITHANAGQVGLKGHVEVRKIMGGYTHRVMFDDDGPANLEISNLQRKILEEIAKDEDETFAKARRKFAKDGEFHVYACNVGISRDKASPLVQVVANLFGVQVFMLAAEMGFTLKADGTWGYHLRYVLPGRVPSEFSQKLTAEVSDYRGLDAMTELIVSARPASPVKPAK